MISALLCPTSSSPSVIHSVCITHSTYTIYIAMYTIVYTNFVLRSLYYTV